jgi:hypothetical protein
MKFSIEIDSMDGSIKIKSVKAFEESLITQPSTTIKSTVDENQNQNAGAFSDVSEIEKHPMGGISSSSMSSSDIQSGGSSEQPPFHSDTFDFLKGPTVGKSPDVQARTTTKSTVDENQNQNAGAFSDVSEI